MDGQNTRQVTEMRGAYRPVDFVLFEDVDGNGHKSLHSPEEPTVLWISLPQGLETP
jgi:hypothetical protein